MIIAKNAFNLFKRRYRWQRPIRSVTIQAINLVSQDTPRQITLLMDAEKQVRMERLDDCIEKIRERFGKNSIRNDALFQNIRMAPEKAAIYISNIERGETIPSLEAIIDIANALYVSTDKLLAGSLFNCKPTHSEKEMDILYDCTKEESFILLECMKAIKNIIRGFKITK